MSWNDRPYKIIAPKFTVDSAGIVGLYRLKYDLLRYEIDAQVIDPDSGRRPDPDDIVIYPDCISGNPYGAKHVVRILMMYAGYFGQDRDFPESEYLYYYCPDFVLNDRNPGNILTIPVGRMERFPYKPEGRSGSCYLAIKYHDYFRLEPFDLPAGCIRIDKKINLEELFSRVKTLYTFDHSMINLEAAMAGVQVVYRFNEKFEAPFDFGPEFDYSEVWKSYAILCRKYEYQQLPQFIARTQERFR